jgi:hypothetical protein
MDNIKKEPESQELLAFNDDMTLLLVPLQYFRAWQILLMSRWKIINVSGRRD